MWEGIPDGGAKHILSCRMGGLISHGRGYARQILFARRVVKTINFARCRYSFACAHELNNYACIQKLGKYPKQTLDMLENFQTMYLQNLRGLASRCAGLEALGIWHDELEAFTLPLMRSVSMVRA